VKLKPSKCAKLDFNITQLSLDGSSAEHLIYSKELEMSAKEKTGSKFDLFFVHAKVIDGAMVYDGVGLINRILTSQDSLLVKRDIPDFFGKVVVTKPDLYSLMLYNLDASSERNVQLKVVLLKADEGLVPEE
jgi:hypothetical protein